MQITPELLAGTRATAQQKGVRGVWEALERPARNAILLSADSGRL